MQHTATDVNVRVISQAAARKGMRHAVLSACWGAVSDVVVRDSSIMIVLAGLIGAGEMISIATTSLIDLAVAFLMLPMAYLTALIGKRRMITRANFVAMAALLCSVATPWMGSGAGLFLLITLTVFAVSLSAYAAAWFPLLNDIVPPEERGLFFGRLRFCWQLTAAIFIVAASFIVGKQASLPVLQLVIAAAALGLLGRIHHIRRMPELPSASPPPAAGILSDILANHHLTGFAVYLFFLYLAASATVPVAFMFAREALHLPDNLTVFISACLMAGLIVGYAVGGRLVHRHGVKRVFLQAHLSFALLNGLFLMVHEAQPWQVYLLVALITIYGFFTACASIAVSSEILALTPANNKIMSIAFCTSMYSAGVGCSRIIASLILGSGILAAEWSIGGRMMTKYHTMFIAHACGVLLASTLLILAPALVRNVRRLPQA